MTREQLSKRIAELTAIRDAAVGQANAANGAIQECQYWMAQLQSSDPSGL